MAEELGKKLIDLCRDGNEDRNLIEVRELLEGTPENIRAEVVNYRNNEMVSRLVDNESHPYIIGWMDSPPHGCFPE